jgi:hypothetical protein
VKNVLIFEAKVMTEYPLTDPYTLVYPVYDAPFFRYISGPNGDFTGWHTIPGEDVVYAPAGEMLDENMVEYMRAEFGCSLVEPTKQPRAYPQKRPFTLREQTQLLPRRPARLVDTIAKFKARSKPKCEDRDTKGFQGIGQGRRGCKGGKGVSLAYSPSIDQV